jgi:hypothetical protein
MKRNAEAGLKMGGVKLAKVRLIVVRWADQEAIY